QVINQDTILSQDKYYEIVSGETVTFRVSAKRSVLEQISGEDFSAVADMEYIENNKYVPVTVYPNKFEDNITIPTKTYYMEVNIGKAVSNQFTIVPKTSGNPAEGYGVESVKSEIKTVTVYGPEDVVSSIASVEAILPVDGANSNVSEEVALTPLNIYGEQVDTTKLDFSKDKVRVTANLCMVKMVPIKVNSSGALADGLTLVSITSDPPYVMIKGESRDLNRVSDIEIPDSVINLNNITADFETTVDINQYLPVNVTVLNAEDATVKIKVDVSNKTTKTFKISTENLTINNLSYRLKGTFDDNYVYVDIVGLPEDLNKLNESTISGYVDASGLSTGTHSVAVTLQLDGEYQAKTATTKLTIK
nr:hypothetical protein [Lachnospiraceae bacterium]